MIPKSAKRFSDKTMLTGRSMSMFNHEASGTVRLWG